MESTTDQIYTSQILKNENFEIVNQEYDENKQILKQKIPLVVCLGRTGSGKSTLLSDLSGKKDIFKASDSFESATNEYTSSLCDIDYRPMMLFDSIGFDDNSNSSTYIEKTAQFLLDVKSGVSCVILTVSVSESREFDTTQVDNVINLLGETVINNLLIVLTMKNRLNKEVAEERITKGYSVDFILSKLLKKGIKITKEQIAYYDMMKDQLSVIKKKIFEFIDKISVFLSPNSFALKGTKDSYELLPFNCGNKKNELLFLSLMTTCYNGCNKLRKFFLKGINEGNKIYQAKREDIIKRYNELEANQRNQNYDLIVNQSFPLSIASQSDKQDKLSESDNLDKFSESISKPESYYKSKKPKDISKKTFYNRLYYGVKVIAKIGGKNIPLMLAPIVIQGQYFLYTVPYVGASLGVGFGIYRLITEKGWKNKVFKSMGELVSGLATGLSLPGAEIQNVTDFVIDTSMHLIDESQNRKNK